MRTARAKIDGSAFYPVMNRILERRYILKKDVAVKFLSLMPLVEAFPGVQVVNYCIMSHPVNLLLRISERKVLSNSEMRVNAELGTRSAERGTTDIGVPKSARSNELQA